MKKVCIIDVAKEAGVSASTVSLVLWQNGSISGMTNETVQAAIQQLGYMYNVVVTNLRVSPPA